ncbi:hypothetical protein QR685DRAFT_582388 [Neurospora intermedia]|uniref:Uncharacterized protein n=1 Tax=Neurospora intermedia TaxID=5142 RepID=A0ABR3D011_NEUIN
METDPDSDLPALRSQLSSDMADDHLDIESTLRSSQSKIKELRKELDTVDIVISKLFASYNALNKAWSKVDQKVGLARERASMEMDDGEEGRDEEEGDDDKKRKRKDSSETEDPTTTSSRGRSKRSSSPIEVSEATLDAVARILPLPLPQLEEDSGNDLEEGDITEAVTGGGGRGGGGGGSSTSHQQQQQGNRKKIHMDKREVKRVRTASPESGSGPESGSELGSVMKSIEGNEVVKDQEGDGHTLDNEGEYGQEELPDNEGQVNLRKDLQVNFVFLEHHFKRYEENMNKRLEMYKSDMNKRVETLENDIYERIEKLERDAKSVEKLENWMGSGWNEWVGETITYGGNNTDDEDEEDSEDEDSEEDEDDSNHDDDDDDDDDDDNYNGNLPSPPDDHPLTNSANH